MLSKLKSETPSFIFFDNCIMSEEGYVYIIMILECFVKCQWTQKQNEHEFFRRTNLLLMIENYVKTIRKASDIDVFDLFRVLYLIHKDIL